MHHLPHGEEPARGRLEPSVQSLIFRDAREERAPQDEARSAAYSRRRPLTLPFNEPAISSSTFGSSMVAGMVQASPSAIFLMVPRRIFPDRVFGNRATVMASLKAATGPSLSRTSATISFSMSAVLLVTPAFSTRKPQGT